VKLFLHIGTEKTGSSFLQTVAARNRKQLSKAGVHFPSGGKRERDMLAGQISPGNGKALWDALKKQSAGSVLAILQQARMQALQENCHAVLISNENIVELAERPGGFSELEKISCQAGYSAVDALLVIREPVDQALSLYKHRAKSGKVKRIDAWMENDFHTIRVLGAFLKEIQSTQINCIFRKYVKDPARMFDIFFHDWLNISIPIEHHNETVNPSLTLSELMFLKAQHGVSAELVPYYYRVLLKLDKSKKGTDGSLEEKYKTIISGCLVRYQEVIHELNKRMLASEQVTVPVAMPSDPQLENQTVVLSEQQLAVILKEQKLLHSVYGRTNLLIRRLARLVVQFFRNFT
jgi:hypothetical protein